MGSHLSLFLVKSKCHCRFVKIQHLNSQYTVKNSQCPNIGTNGLMEFDQEELNKLYQNNDCLNKVIQIRFTNKDIHYFVKGVN